jgi:hypothetical protein
MTYALRVLANRMPVLFIVGSNAIFFVSKLPGPFGIGYSTISPVFGSRRSTTSALWHCPLARRELPGEVGRLLERRIQVCRLGGGDVHESRVFQVVPGGEYRHLVFVRFDV